MMSAEMPCMAAGCYPDGLPCDLENACKALSIMLFFSFNYLVLGSMKITSKILHHR
jgi:hypothetical protein